MTHTESVPRIADKPGITEGANSGRRAITTHTENPKIAMPITGKNMLARMKLGTRNDKVAVTFGDVPFTTFRKQLKGNIRSIANKAILYKGVRLMMYANTRIA
jgi:hypothetical protein